MTKAEAVRQCRRLRNMLPDTVDFIPSDCGGNVWGVRIGDKVYTDKQMISRTVRQVGCGHYRQPSKHGPLRMRGNMIPGTGSAWAR